MIFVPKAIIKSIGNPISNIHSFLRLSASFILIDKELKLHQYSRRGVSFPLIEFAARQVFLGKSPLFVLRGELELQLKRQESAKVVTVKFSYFRSSSISVIGFRLNKTAPGIGDPITPIARNMEYLKNVRILCSNSNIIWKIWRGAIKEELKHD